MPDTLKVSAILGKVRRVASKHALMLEELLKPQMLYCQSIINQLLQRINPDLYM